MSLTPASCSPSNSDAQVGSGGSWSSWKNRISCHFKKWVAASPASLSYRKNWLQTRDKMQNSITLRADLKELKQKTMWWVAGHGWRRQEKKRKHTRATRSGFRNVSKLLSPSMNYDMTMSQVHAYDKSFMEFQLYSRIFDTIQVLTYTTGRPSGILWLTFSQEKRWKNAWVCSSIKHQLQLRSDCQQFIWFIISNSDTTKRAFSCQA